MVEIDIGNFCQDLRNAWFLLNTARKQSLGQGNIFAPGCHSVHRGSTWAGNPRQVHPPGRYIPIGRYTPWAGTLPRQVPPLAGTPSWAGTSPWQVRPQASTPLGRYTPWPGTPPWAGTPDGRYTPWAGTPPGRFIPWQVHPLGRYTPLGAVHAGRYRQQAGRTHPTGMHSCLVLVMSVYRRENKQTRWYSVVFHVSALHFSAEQNSVLSPSE